MNKDINRSADRSGILMMSWSLTPGMMKMISINKAEVVEEVIGEEIMS